MQKLRIYVSTGIAKGSLQKWSMHPKLDDGKGALKLA